MKKLIARTAALAVLSTGVILAQRSLHGDFGGHGGPPPSTNPPDVATIVSREVSFLTSLLTLTTGQQTQATTITTAQTALVTAVKANDTAGINTQATAIGNAHAQIVAIQAKADAAFYALLTADQKTKLTNADSDFGSDLGLGLHLPGGIH